MKKDVYVYCIKTSDAKITLVAFWGATYDIKDNLKAHGCRYDAEAKMWYKEIDRDSALADIDNIRTEVSESVCIIRGRVATSPLHDSLIALRNRIFKNDNH